MGDDPKAGASAPFYFTTNIGDCLSGVVPADVSNVVSTVHQPEIGDIVAIWLHPGQSANAAFPDPVRAGDAALIKISKPRIFSPTAVSCAFGKEPVRSAGLPDTRITPSFSSHRTKSTKTSGCKGLPSIFSGLSMTAARPWLAR